MEVVAKNCCGSAGHRLPAEDRSFVPTPKDNLIPMKYLRQVDGVNLLATLTDSWMLLSDFEAIRDAFISVNFYSPFSDCHAADLWRPVVERFLDVEVKDSLERINFLTPFFEPLSIKKTRIFDNIVHELVVEDKRPSERDKDQLMYDAHKSFRNVLRCKRLRASIDATRNNGRNGGKPTFVFLPGQTEPHRFKQLLIWSNNRKNERSPAFHWMTQENHQAGNGGGV